jgi:ATP-dependent exoDNAse (exonuclease V) alpha subunit
LPYAVRIWKKTQTIIIDEISMVRADILDFIKWTLEKNDIYLKSIQWIIVGDTKQLEAVLTNEDKPFFPYEKNCFKESKFFNELKFKEIELDVVKRQSDNEFIRNLNILRNTGRLSPYFNQFKNKKLEGTIITSTRKQKDSINEFFLNKIEEKEIILKGEISNEQNFKENHFPVKKEIIVKNGCKVKYLRNEKDGRVNGTEGTFVEKDKSYLFVDEAGEEYPLYKSTFERHEYKIVEGKPKLVIVCSIDQYPIAVKYGATVHGSQGLTHEKVVVNLHGMFAKNQLYVAISRCKSPDGLCIINTSNVINFFQQFFDNNKKKENDF